jgi:hypothetical protein
VTQTGGRFVGEMKKQFALIEKATIIRVNGAYLGNLHFRGWAALPRPETYFAGWTTRVRLNARGNSNYSPLTAVGQNCHSGSVQLESALSHSPLPFKLRTREKAT